MSVATHNVCQAQQANVCGFVGSRSSEVVGRTDDFYSRCAQLAGHVATCKTGVFSCMFMSASLTC